MVGALLLSVALAIATPSPADDANIKLSMAIVQRIGDRLWPQWSKAPFAIDLITPDGPVLVNVDKPFTPPSFPPNFEATFPLSNGVPTIVIGVPQYSKSTPVRWSVTLIHEHFHQWQDSWPQYVAATEKLGLAKPGDKNAMWMLNYPFPYQDARIDSGFAAMSNALADAIDAIGKSNFKQKAGAYFAARHRFEASLKPNDYRYFAFQCWQEGVARYTEIAAPRLAVAAHANDPTFLTDAQAIALKEDADQTYARVLKRLRTIRLNQDERSNFYAVGAAEALLLDELSPNWRARYLDPRMDLSVYFPG
ncbi:MAG: hypothetical protein JO165_12380 [Candidatus Eremiobacteraeota bacterium]|nr:hypothetical protein [Candidatus Eremiobacteraeota bacterium]